MVVAKDTLALKEKYEARPRVCNLGYLRTAYMRENGKVRAKIDSTVDLTFLT